jgi:hypothetical protein
LEKKAIQIMIDRWFQAVYVVALRFVITSLASSGLPGYEEFGENWQIYYITDTISEYNHFLTYTIESSDGGYKMRWDDCCESKMEHT